MPRDGGSSDATVTARAEALAAFGRTVGISLAPKRFELDPGVFAAVDGCAEVEGRTIVVEVCVRAGVLMSADDTDVVAAVLRLGVVKAHLLKGGALAVDAFFVLTDAETSRVFVDSRHMETAKRLGVEVRLVQVPQ